MAIKIKALERFASSIREQAQALKTWPFGVLAPPIAPEDAVGPQRPKKGRHNPGWGVSPINSGSHQIKAPKGRDGFISGRSVRENIGCQDGLEWNGFELYFSALWYYAAGRDNWPYCHMEVTMTDVNR